LIAGGVIDRDLSRGGQTEEEVAVPELKDFKVLRGKKFSTYRQELGSSKNYVCVHESVQEKGVLVGDREPGFFQADLLNLG